MRVLPQDCNQGTESVLDTQMGNKQELTYLKWNSSGQVCRLPRGCVVSSKTVDPNTHSHEAQVLAIGTQKGSLVVYNKRTLKRQSILGKHVKRITCGAWNCENKLALGSDDRQV